MWVCLNNAFVSIVAPTKADLVTFGVPAKMDTLMVRARDRSHLEVLFPEGRVHSTPSRDYQFRVFVDREYVAALIEHQVRGIKYTNFKNSVRNDLLHDLYAKVWGVMLGLGRKTAKARN